MPQTVREVSTARNATVRICDGRGEHRGQGLLLCVESELVVLTCHHVVAPLDRKDLYVAIPAANGSLSDPIPACYDVQRSRPDSDAVVLRLADYPLPAEWPLLLHLDDQQSFTGPLWVTGLNHFQTNIFNALLAASTRLSVPVEIPGTWPNAPKRYEISQAFPLTSPTDSRPGISGSVIIHSNGVLGLAHFSRSAGKDQEREVYLVPLSVWAEGWPALRNLLEPLIIDRWSEGLSDYLSALKQFCEELPCAHLPGRSPPTLSQIYVEQSATEQQPKQSKLETQTVKVQTVEEALRHHAHLILEGGPGMGKSSLIYHLAVKAIHNQTELGDFPCVPVPIFARGLAGQQGGWSSRLLQQVHAQLGPLLRKNLPDDFFERDPPRGNWLILLDGLDEVVNHKERDELVMAIQQRTQTVAGPNRFIITTRPIADANQLLGPNLGHYQLRPFELDQVKTFVTLWFKQRPNCDQSDPVRFLTLVEESRIGDLARVPLLLTIAALVYEADRELTLPTRRASLYEQFVRILLNSELSKKTHQQFRDEWDQRYPEQGKGWVDKLFELRRPLLEALARWQQEGGVGLLRNEADRWLLDEGLLPKLEDSCWRREQLGLLLLRTGLITHRGAEDAFLHPTIREYLVASSLCRRCPPDSPEAKPLVKQYSGQGREEVLLFLLGIWNENDSAIDHLINYVFREIENGAVLAGAALAEGVLVSNPLVEVITQGLLEHPSLTLDKLSYIFSVKRKIWRSPLEVLGTLRGRPRVVSGLDRLARDPAVGTIQRGEAVRALGNLGRAEEIHSLAYDPDLSQEVRHVAAATLGRLGKVEDAVPILIALATDPGRRNYPWDAYNSAESLSALDRRDDAAVLYIYLARDMEYHYQARAWSARALWRLGRRSDGCALAQRQASQPSKSGLGLDIVASVLREIELPDQSAQLLRNEARDAATSLLDRAHAAGDLAESGHQEEAIALLREMARDPYADGYWLREVADKLKELELPCDVGDLLFTRATDRSVSGGMRLRSILYLADYRRLRVVHSLLRSLTDDPTNKLWVRKEASKHLFVLERYRVVHHKYGSVLPDRLWSLAQRVLHRFSPVRLLRLLRRVDHLLALASNKGVDHETRSAAVEALAALKCGDALLGLVSDPAVDWGQVECIRPLAIDPLAKFCRTEDLVDLASDGAVDGGGRQIAIRALAASGHPDLLPPLLRAFARDRSLDRWERSWAVEILADPSYLDEVSDLVADATVDASTRIKCAEILVERGQLDLVFQLANAAETDPWTRIGLAELLHRRERADNACSVLQRVIQDSATSIGARANAVAALGRIGGVTELLGLAHDPGLNTDIRKEAIWSLGEMTAAADSVLSELRSLAGTEVDKDISPAVHDAIRHIQFNTQVSLSRNQH